METFTFSTLFWLTASGATIGWIVGLVITTEGVSVESNIVWGIISALGIGIISLLLELGAPLLFAFIGTLGILFIVNMFHLHHIEELFEDEKR